jgi:hypothetical protein
MFNKGARNMRPDAKANGGWVDLGFGNVEGARVEFLELYKARGWTVILWSE